METHIHTRGYTIALWGSSINTIGYTSSVGVQHGNTQSHRIYKRPWGSSMETHIHTRGYTSSVGSSINTIGYTSSVGVQHGNTQSHRIYKRPWKSSMETHIHTRGYTGSVGENLHIGRNLVLTLRGQSEDNNNLSPNNFLRRVTIQCF